MIFNKKDLFKKIHLIKDSNSNGRFNVSRKLLGKKVKLEIVTPPTSERPGFIPIEVAVDRVYEIKSQGRGVMIITPVCLIGARVRIYEVD